MRKMGELMKDLGFNQEASMDVKKAFIRHLVHASDRSSPQNLTPIAKQSEGKKEEPPVGQQLSFDPELLKAK